MAKIELAALLTVLDELVDGTAPTGAWLLNPDDPGLLTVLDRLSADDASAVPAGAGSSVAAHVDHLRYGLELLNRWSDGEEPFAGADYSASWHRTAVSPAEWTFLRAELRRQAHAWRAAMNRQHDFPATEQAAVVASIAHLAYHLGAIRQINRSIRGPSAKD
jgi:hypothetical protein